MKELKFILLCILLSGVCAWGHAATVQEPVVSGSFYPADSITLSKLVQKYLRDVPQKQTSGDPYILIVPHAGYIYSGPVAAYGYKEIEGVKYDTVVIIAFSHHVYYPGVSIFDGDYYRTPLGDVPVDKEVVERLRASDDWFTFYPPAHLREHSLEVQLPFLQETVPTLKIVPLIMCDMSEKSARHLADGLYAALAGKKALIVISTDLSHYETYNEAKAKDEQTIGLITSLSLEECLNGIKGDKLDACGKGPLLAAQMLAEKHGARDVKVLHYANSGDTAGDKSRVVGYAAIAILKKESEGTVEPKIDPKERLISDAGRKQLLSIARQTLTDHFTKGKVLAPQVDDPALQARNGAFVTLHKNGRLRGCIGCFTANEPLYATVQDFVLNSAFHDPRFPPLRKEELSDIDIEISVLSPMRKIASIDEIELGKHGIWIKKGFRSGTFLPQVATETGWTKEEFLGHCAQDKAGIGWDGWKDAEILIYTAEVFGEKNK
jgi:AmmeMemoRadiSam system protein B/AmmeMemoRadiSam system protein A